MCAQLTPHGIAFLPGFPQGASGEVTETTSGSSTKVRHSARRHCNCDWLLRSVSCKQVLALVHGIMVAVFLDKKDIQ
jgi:hypothetical protein